MSDYMQVIRDGFEMCMSCDGCRKCPIFITVGMDFCPFDSPLGLDGWKEIVEKIHQWKSGGGK